MQFFKKGVACVLAMSMLGTLGSFPTSAEGNAELENLRVNYVVDPVGIDAEPKFSWNMESSEIGQKQTAYQITVFEDKEMSKQVWTSDKVESDLSIGIPYGGKQLSPSTRYYWQVKAWDKDGNAVVSAEKPYFETGLKEANALTDAKWLKAPEMPAEKTDFSLEYDMTFQQDAVGMVFSAKDKSNFIMWQFNTNNHKEGNNRLLYLRPHFCENGNFRVEEININDKLTEADVLNKKVRVKITVIGDKISTYVNDKLVNEYTYNGAVFSDIGFRACHDNTNFERGLIDNILYKKYDAKGNETVVLDCNFDDGNNPFSGAVVSDGALSIAQPDNVTAVILTEQFGVQTGLPLFRHKFTTAAGKEIESVKLYSTALGIYEMYYNGARVGRTMEDGSVLYDELKPGWTDYEKRVQYYTYDITRATENGDNAIMAAVAPGWWNGRMLGDVYGHKPEAFKAKILINYKDGTSETVCTDNTWKSIVGGAVRAAEIYDGEIYDANFEHAEMSLSTYDDAEWLTPAYSTDFNGVVSCNPGTSVQVVKDLSRAAESVVIYNGTENDGTTHGKIKVVNDSWQKGGDIILKAGETAIVDFGQDMVGRPVLNLKNPKKGTVVTMHFAEMLNDTGIGSRGSDGPEGSLYTANYRSAKSTAQYIAKGDAAETYRTLHSFYGYRYMSISASADITVTDLYSEVITSSSDDTGKLTTSDASINQLISNIMWGQRGNYVSVPTDCPQRDERLGWSGDTQAFIGAATYNANVAGFYNKWINDLQDSQRGNGSYTDTIPFSFARGDGNSGWADAGVIVPYNLYKMYGNKDILEYNYASMTKFMNFLKTNRGGLAGGNLSYGDWLTYEARNPTRDEFVALCYYAYSTQLMAKIADILGKPDDVAKYTELYGKIKDRFRTKYLTQNEETGVYRLKTTVAIQTSWLLALKTDLFPDAASTEKAINDLVANIKKKGNKLSTGFLGTSTITQTLSDVGQDNMAYTLLLQRENPSWLYSIDQGATTIWERWNSYTKESGFGDVGMNSFNHYAYGAVAEWMYRYMVGIEADDEVTAFKTFTLQPTPDTRTADEIPANEKKMTSASGEYRSMYGTIKSGWTTADGVFDYKATVPANTTATLKFPSLGVNTVSLFIGGTEVSLKGKKSGDPLAGGITYLGRENGRIIMSLESGSYEIKEGKDEPIHLESISFDKTEVSLTEGESCVYEISYQPADTTDDKTTTIVSSDPAVARIDADKITAVSAGTATITATCGDKTAVLKVTVKAKEQVKPDPKPGDNVNKPGDNSNKKPVVTVKKAPKAPTKVKVRKKTKTSVKITAKKVSGAKTYKIYMRRGKKGKFKLIKTVKKPLYIKKKLKRKNTYYFKLRAANGKLISKYSKTVKIKLK